MSDIENPLGTLGKNPTGNTAVQDLFSDDGVEYGTQASNIDISTGFDAEVKLGAKLALYWPLSITMVLSPLAYLLKVFNKIVFTLGGQYEILVGNSSTWITGNTNTTIGGNVWEKTGALKYEEYGAKEPLSSASPKITKDTTPFTNIIKVASDAAINPLQPDPDEQTGRTTVNFGSKSSYCYGQAVSVNAVGPLQVVTGYSCKYTLSGKHVDWIADYATFSTKFEGTYGTQTTNAMMYHVTTANLILNVDPSTSDTLRTTLTEMATDYATLKTSLNTSMNNILKEEGGTDYTAKLIQEADKPVVLLPETVPSPCALLSFKSSLIMDTQGENYISCTGTFGIYGSEITISSTSTNFYGVTNLGLPELPPPETPLTTADMVAGISEFKKAMAETRAEAAKAAKEAAEAAANGADFGVAS
jgi:hypothetical protein